MYRVEIDAHGTVDAAADEVLLELCERAEIPMDSACGGFAACNSCRIDVVEGGENLSPVVEEELPFLDAENQRLGCQTRVLGPVRIRLSPGM
jgi:ferredoxin